MADCDKTVFADIPFTTSYPGWDEIVMFHLADGTTVTRRWIDIFATTSPPDVEKLVVASGTPGVDLINGDTDFIITNFIGKRGRMYRNKLRESTIVVAGDTSYSFTSTNGKFSFPAASTGEIFIFESY